MVKQIDIDLVTSDDFQSRFWSRVDKSGDCWIWGSTKDRDGYGLLKIGRRMYRAHRSAYASHYRKDPGQNIVMHKCDTPGCSNPSHLEIGTTTDNSRDMVRKGRHNKSKLNGKVAEDIRNRFAAGEDLRLIANEFLITERTAMRVFNGIRYASAGGPITRMGRRRGEKHPHAKLKDDQVKSIRNMYSTGHYRQIDVAEFFGTSRSVVSAVVNRSTWGHVK